MTVLSICVLVKNEEKYLPRLLDNLISQGMLHRVKSESVEVVVGDTGSTDETLERLDPYLETFINLRLVNVEWHNHFAKARNTLHDQAHGNWILWADVDMTFSGFGRLLEQLARLQEQKKTVDGLWTSILDESTIPAKRFAAVRIIRKEVRMVGRVHETPEVRNVLASSLIVVHDRQESAEDAAKKHARYRSLLEAEVDENPSNPYPYSYLVEDYFRMGGYADVAKLLDRKPYWDNYDAATVAAIELSGNRIFNAGIAARASVVMNPHDVRGMGILAQALESTGQFGYAREWYEAACAETFESVTGSGEFRYSEDEIVVAPRMGLAGLYGNMGMISEAEKVLEETLKLYPNTAQRVTIQRNLDKIRAGRKKSILLQ